MIYFFSGVDGAGKSTHSKLLTYYLVKKCNCKVRLVWMRWFALTSYPLLAICRFLGLTLRPRGSTIPLRLYWMVKPISRLWLNLFLLDYAIYASYVSTNLFCRKSVVVADRFALDILVDVIYDTRLNPLKHLVGRFFYLLLYKLLRTGKARGVVMLVDEETVFSRRKDIPLRSYVRFRIPIYRKLAKHLGLPVIDGRAELTENFKIVLKAVGVNG